MARACGLESAASHSIAIAAAELASNAARHGGGGYLTMRALHPAGVELVCVDRGPGIADVELALSDGWSGGRHLGPDDPWAYGLGTGLGAVKRATDELRIERRDGGGTIVIARRYRR